MYTYMYIDINFYICLILTLKGAQIYRKVTKIEQRILIYSSLISFNIKFYVSFLSLSQPPSLFSLSDMMILRP